MRVRIQIRNLARKLAGFHIYTVLPRGIDFFQDVRNDLPVFQADIIFDVGANVGQSVSKFLRCFPESQIYCFEPATDTFRQLQENLEGSERVHSFQLALGANRGKAKLLLQGTPDAFRLLDPSKDEAANGNSNVEQVDLETLDNVCRDWKIDHISYLKIDTEGGDLAVLKGADNLLREHRIDLLQVEAGMNWNNERHVPFEVLKKFLESRRYFLFGIYEQVQEWPTEEPHLRRTDPVFISEPLVRANRRCAKTALR